MRRTGKIGLIAAALLTAASSLPEPASSQVPDAFDVRNPGFAPASLPFDTKSMLMTASTGWVASQGMPGAFVGCPRPSPYMFGFNPGLFHYGWYMSPFDVRFSRSWFFPANRWYAGWGGWPGFGYGSSWPAAGPGAWGPWPGSSGMCGPGSTGSSFYWGAGGYGYGYGGYSGFGRYGSFPGYGGFGSGYPGYGGYSGYSGYGGGFPGSPRSSGGLGIDTGSGYIPESVRQAKGFRVIESRPTTGGADLRRTEPSWHERWFEQFEADTRQARSTAPTSRDPIGDALARGMASERASRESISDAIARARAAERTGSAKTWSAPERTRAAAPARTAPTRATPPARAAPTRTAAPSSKPSRATPRSSPRPAPAKAPRSSRGSSTAEP